MSRQDASSELSLRASKEDAMQAVLDALPKDAVVRAEDDGVGRFAGQRTIAIVSRDESRLMLFEGSWGDLKPRLDDAQVEVAFKGDSSPVVARIKREAVEPKAGSGALIGDLLNRGLTVAVLVVAYHWVREIPIDTQLTITIAVLGGLAWSVIAFLIPKKEDRGLEGKVRDALAPLVIEAEEDDDDDDDESKSASNKTKAKADDDESKPASSKTDAAKADGDDDDDEQPYDSKVTVAD